MVRNILIVFAILLLIGLNAVGLMSPDTRFASVNDFRSRHTEQYVFTDSAVVTRRAQAAQDTREWHARSCAEDPRGYDCKESGRMIREAEVQNTGPRLLSKRMM